MVHQALVLCQQSLELVYYCQAPESVLFWPCFKCPLALVYGGFQLGPQAGYMVLLLLSG